MNSNILLFLALLLAGGLGTAGVILLILGAAARRQEQAGQKWPTATGAVTSASVVPSRSGEGFEPQVEYEYLAGDQR